MDCSVTTRPVPTPIDGSGGVDIGEGRATTRWAGASD